MASERVYTISEVADILKISERTVRKLITQGELEAFQAGNQWRIRKDVLERYMQRKRK